MSHPDARTLAPPAQEKNRRLAVRLRQEGRSFTEIGAVLGVHYTTVSMWWQRSEAGGWTRCGPRRVAAAWATSAG